MRSVSASGHHCHTDMNQKAEPEPEQSEPPLIEVPNAFFTV